MTSAILSSAGRSTGSFLLKSSGFTKIPFSGQISSRIKGLTSDAFGKVGSEIDELIFGVDEQNYVRGQRPEYSNLKLW